ncbi:MAG: hypothetical protein KDN18_06340 [Verrucomicrobiae bacterium]|nr:hypothetical protein [Verrucomicrobiae bacterium]
MSLILMRKKLPISPKLLILAGVLLAVIAVLWFARRPIVSGVKEWRAASLVEKAEDAFAEEESREARQLASAAWQLEPKRIETLRELMQLARKSAMPELPAMTLVVFFHEERNLEDRVEILKWAVDRRDAAFFDQLYPNLGQEERSLPPFRLLLAKKLALEGRYVEALELARGLEKEGDPETSLFLATVLSRMSGNPAAARQAADLIHGLLSNLDNDVALEAWRSLFLLPETLRDPGVSFDPVVWLEGREGVTSSDRVLADRLLTGRLPESEKVAAMENAVRERISEPGALQAVIRWYLESGGAEKLLSLPEEPFLSSASVFSSRLQVLLDLQRFAEAESWLAKAPEDFPESVAGSLEAVFARRAGRDSEAVSAWRRVIDRASSLQNYGDCLSILRIAEKFGETRPAMEVVDALVSFPPNRLPPGELLEFLEPWFSGRRDQWLTFWRGILRSRPGEAFTINQVAFLELAEDEGIDLAFNSARTAELVKRYPGVPSYRATHAFCLIREGKQEEALAVLRAAGLNWNEADPSIRSAYVLALRKAGAREESDTMAAGLRLNAIPQVRREVLEKLLNLGDPSSSS